MLTGENTGQGIIYDGGTSEVLQGYERLAYGELDQVGFVVDVELVH